MTTYTHNRLCVYVQQPYERLSICVLLNSSKLVWLYVIWNLFRETKLNKKTTCFFIVSIHFQFLTPFYLLLWLRRMVKVKCRRRRRKKTRQEKHISNNNRVMRPAIYFSIYFFLLYYNFIFISLCLLFPFRLFTLCSYFSWR